LKKTEKETSYGINPFKISFSFSLLELELENPKKVFGN
jgi:hypothetical protein